MDMSLSELQEFVMDREAWRAAIHGVEKSRTRLSDWTELKFLQAIDNSVPLVAETWIAGPVPWLFFRGSVLSNSMGLH